MLGDVDLDTLVAMVGDPIGPTEAFQRRLVELYERHRRKPSLIERLDRAGLTIRVGTR
jgi:hypothetical protein